MRVILYLAQTVNGFIANEKDETPWSQEEFRAFYLRTREIGNLIIGRRTYDVMKKGREFGLCGNPVTVVLTRSKAPKSKDAIFVRSPRKAIEALRAKGFRTATVAGGGSLNSSFLKEGLIDEVWLDIEPLVFGTGVPLFEKSSAKAKLKLTGIRRISRNTIRICYKVVK